LHNFEHLIPVVYHWILRMIPWPNPFEGASNIQLCTYSTIPVKSMYVYICACVCVCGWNHTESSMVVHSRILFTEHETNN